MPPQGIVHRKFHVAQMFRESNGVISKKGE